MKYKRRFFSCLFLLQLASSPPTYAGRADARNECESQFIQSIDFSKDLGKFHALVNYCNSIEFPGPFPQELESLLKQLGQVHRQVATLINLEPRRLFDPGIKIEIIPRNEGVLSTDSGTDDVSLSVYPDWNGDPISTSLYTHELGHLVTLRLKNFFPAVAELGKELLLSEGIADLFAYEVGGLGPTGFILPDLNLPACFAGLRQITFLDTFNNPAHFFHTSYSNSKLLACCEFLDSTLTHTPHSQLTCGALKATQPERPLKPLDLSIFSPENTSMQSIDPHQVGIVINSFLLQLSEQLGQRPLPLLLRAITRSEKSGIGQAFFQCHTLRQPEKVVTVNILSLEGVFKEMRSEGGEDGLKAFDRLWNYYSMEKGMYYSRMSEDFRAKLAAKKLLRDPHKRACENVNCSRKESGRKITS